MADGRLRDAASATESGTSAVPTPSEFTVGLFTDWTEQCGCHRIQKELQAIKREAKETGKTLDMVFAERDMPQGLVDLNRKCRQRFGMWDSIGDLAELGSGVVLYFYFMRWTAFILLLLCLAGMPSLVVYGSVDELESWQWSRGTDRTPDEGNTQAFHEDSSVRKVFMHQAWAALGNVGPNNTGGAPMAIIPACYLIFIVLFMVLCRFKYLDQCDADRWVDEQTIAPSDFSLLVYGLPLTATDEGEIAAFFRSNALADRDDVQIVKVVIGWDAFAYNSKQREVEKLQRKVQRLQVQLASSSSADGSTSTSSSDTEAEVGDERDQLLRSINELRKELQDPEQSASGTGTAVVVFQHQDDLRAALERWTGFWPHWLGREDSAGSCWFPGRALPCFQGQSGWAGGSRLYVTQAPNPGDIRWEEMGVGFLWKLWSRFWPNALMIALVLLSYTFIGKLETYRESLNHDSLRADTAKDWFDLKALSLIPAATIAGVNFLLRMCALFFGSLGHYSTLTDQEFSQTLKLTLATLLNTFVVLIAVHDLPWRWYLSDGLLIDLFFVMLLDSVASRLVLIIDFTYVLNYYFRRKLDKSQVDGWNETMRANIRGRTVEAEEAMLQIRWEVEEMKKAFEPEEVDMPDRYARILVTLYGCVLYAPVFPIVAYIGVAGILLQYTVDKYLMVRWWKRPRMRNAGQAKWCLRTAKYLTPPILMCGITKFMIPSMGERGPYLFVGLAVFAMLLVNSLPLQIVRKWHGMLCGKRLRDESSLEVDYYQAQYMWPKGMKYHTDHFYYKSLPRSKNPEILKSPEQDGAHSVIPIGRRRGSDGLGPPGAQAQLGVAVGARCIGAPEPRYTWSFEVGSSFMPFAQGCQQELEAKYQRWSAGEGTEKVEVVSGGNTIIVDLKEMTQRTKRSGGREGKTVRKVQRIPHE